MSDDIKDKLAPLHAEIFRQLSEIPQFQEHLDTNYNIMVYQDDETQYIGVKVEMVSFEESMKRLEDIRQKKAEAEPKIFVPDTKIIS